MPSDQADEELLARYTPKEEEEEDDESSIDTVFAWSCRRQITAENVLSLNIRSVLKEYDAFDPVITFVEQFVGRIQNDKQRYRVKNPSFTMTLSRSRQEITFTPEFVRVDFFKFER